MRTKNSTTTALSVGQILRASGATASWKAVVNRSVHAPVTSSSTPPSSLLNPRPSGGLNMVFTYPNLWVENGVIWQLPSLLVGFTSYSAATSFFASAKTPIYDYVPAPASWYQGLPFSATDFPILRYASTVSSPGNDTNLILIWPSLNTMGFASTFLSLLPVNQPLLPSPAPSAGPVFPTYTMSNFSADSPKGTQTFHAQHLLYAPWPNSGSGSNVYTGLWFDMGDYAWIQTLG